MAGFYPVYPTTPCTAEDVIAVENMINEAQAVFKSQLEELDLKIEDMEMKIDAVEESINELLTESDSDTDTDTESEGGSFPATSEECEEPEEDYLV